jgi:hypothetical protein
MPHVFRDIEDEFIEGTYEVYKSTTKKEVFIAFLDSEKTSTNVYGESTNKVYSPFKKYYGKISMKPEGSDVDSLTKEYPMSVSLHIGDFIKNKEKYDVEGLDKFKTVIVEYKGLLYKVVQITPISFIRGIPIEFRLNLSPVKNRDFIIFVEEPEELGEGNEDVEDE